MISEMICVVKTKHTYVVCLAEEKIPITMKRRTEVRNLIS